MVGIILVIVVKILFKWIGITVHIVDTKLNGLLHRIKIMKKYGPMIDEIPGLKRACEIEKPNYTCDYLLKGCYGCVVMVKWPPADRNVIAGKFGSIYWAFWMDTYDFRDRLKGVIEEARLKYDKGDSDLLFHVQGVI